MSKDRFAAMETCARVIDAGSFSAGARAAGGSQSQISKNVAALEQRLGSRLLNRTTRHLSLTDAGSAYYERCKSALAAIYDAEEEVRAVQAAIRGLLRI